MFTQRLKEMLGQNVLKVMLMACSYSFIYINTERKHSEINILKTSS